MAPKNYYEILGVEKTATDKEIRQAYRNLAATLQTLSNSTDSVTLERIQAINQAYECLSDPDDRKEYDAHLAQSQTGSDAGAPNTSLSNESALAFVESSATLPVKPKRRFVPGFVINLLMLVFGVIIGFVGRPIVMPPPDPQAALLQQVMAATRHFKGNANAPVTIIEFADFQ